MAKTKINFTIPADIANGASSAFVLGDFNNWDVNKGTVLKKQKDGSLKAAVELEAGKEYAYRFLLDNGIWVNDTNADAYIFDSYFQVDNCLVKVPAPKATAKAAKPAKVEAAAPKAAAPKKAKATKKVEAVEAAPKAKKAKATKAK